MILLMPSQTSTSLLQKESMPTESVLLTCQCPHGLMPHCYENRPSIQLPNRLIVSMPSRANASLLLISFVMADRHVRLVSMPSRANASLLHLKWACMTRNATTCQCPHGLMPHCYRSIVAQLLLFRQSVNALTG